MNQDDKLNEIGLWKALQPHFCRQHRCSGKFNTRTWRWRSPGRHRDSQRSLPNRGMPRYAPNLSQRRLDSI